MPGSGPGGRWFKSIRPDQFFQVQQLTKRERAEDRLVQDQEVSVQISLSRFALILAGVEG
jgi:hypothetical protein